MQTTYCGLEGWGVVVRYNGTGADTPCEITVRTKTGDEVTVPAAQAKPETIPARLFLAEQLKRKWWGVPNAELTGPERRD
jgi:hypothetical protein